MSQEAIVKVSDGLQLPGSGCGGAGRASFKGLIPVAGELVLVVGGWEEVIESHGALSWCSLNCSVRGQILGQGSFLKGDFYSCCRLACYPIPHLLIPSRWGLGFPHINLEGTQSFSPLQ